MVRLQLLNGSWSGGGYFAKLSFADGILVINFHCLLKRDLIVIILQHYGQQGGF